MKKILLSLIGVLCSMSMWADTTIYSWSSTGSDDSGVTEIGGKVSGNILGVKPNDNVGTLYSIQLTDKIGALKSVNAHAEITLSEGNFHNGDKITVRGYYNKGSVKPVSLAILPGSIDGTTGGVISTDCSSYAGCLKFTDEDWVDLRNETTLSTTEHTYVLDNDAYNSVNTITLTRNASSTNLQLLYVEIVRPAGKLSTSAPTLTTSWGENTTVTITNNESSAEGKIYYTTDGTTPSKSSTEYTAPINISTTTTKINAIFIPTDGETYSNSDVATTTAVSANVQTYTARTNFAVSADIEAGQILTNKNIIVESLFAASKKSQSYEIQGEKVSDYVQVRTAGVSNTGVITENPGSTALRIRCFKNGIFTAKYRRQADGGSSTTYTVGNGKDVHLSKAGSNQLETGVAEFPSTQDYSAGVQQWELEAGETYVLWSSGTTVPLFGFTFAPIHTVNAWTPGENYATLCLDYDAVIPSGVKAYKGTKNSDIVNLEEITEVIPANTGVVIKSEDGSSAIFKKKITKAETIKSGNELLGCISAKTDIAAESTYVLGYTAEDGVCFFNNATTSVGANKAYMNRTAGAKALRLTFNEITGIKSVNTEATVNKAVKRIMNGQLVIEKAGKMFNAAGTQIK